MTRWTPPVGSAGPRGDGARHPEGSRRWLRCDGGDPAVGLFESLPDPALRYAGDGDVPTVAALNPAYATAFGADAVEGDRLDRRLRSDLAAGDAVDDEDDDRDPVGELVAAASDGKQRRAVVAGDTADGEREYLARVVPLSAGGGGPRGHVLLTDVTAQRERSRALAAERDRLDDFASIVSHDLRNPLEVAKIQLEAGRRRGEDDHFEKVADAHDRIERIVEDVLTLARQGQVIDDVDEVALSAVAEDAWDAVATPEASLVVEGDPVVLADAHRLQELLENLFRNAVEHGSTSPPSHAQEDAVEHGSTSPRRAEHDGTGVTVTLGRTDDGFYVADDGPGIPAEERDRVFEAGVSTGEEGTGLGLVIVRRIADAHGWTVSAGDAEDGGARFDFDGVEVVT